MADNPPAFPAGTFNSHEPTYGMTLRDWFAGQAFGVVLGTAKGLSSLSPEERAEMFAGVARLIYEGTDAMLVERERV